MLTVTNLAKDYGAQVLFRDASFQLVEGQRYGLVGANGSGKSTLLRILAGRESASDGQVSLPRRASLGFLEQDHFRYERERIVDVVMMGRHELWQAMQELEQLLANADQEFDADRYGHLEELVRQQDGYSLEARAGEILEGLGIPTAQHKQPLSTLSGGFKLRVLLAQTLAAQPDVLLLDEPTNHLDILSMRWLEKFLEGVRGVVVVISHDHRFLDNVCTRILDVDYETVTQYTGNYSAFVEAKREERERREAEIEKREKEIAHHKEFVDRFKAKATKARQAQSKVKLMEKIQIDSLPRSSRRYPRFRFQERRHAGRAVLELEGLSKAYGSNQVLSDVSLRVQRGDRLAIIGPNGIGKSTLLKIAMGKVEADSGEVTWGYETYPGYFPQDARELLDHPRATVESWLWECCPGEPVGFVRGKLGAVLFSGDEVHKKLGALSGGEAARLVFCRLGIAQPNVLVLDEPTNHLDIEGIEALVEALERYDGTVILVSHDRWFVSRLATRILEIKHDGINDFVGGYGEYLERCGDDHLDAASVVLKARSDKREDREARDGQPAASSKVAEKADGGGRKQPSAADKKRLRKLRAERDELTREIEQIEGEVAQIDTRFCQPGFFEQTAQDEVQLLQTRQAEARARAKQLMSRWERIETEIESLGESG